MTINIIRSIINVNSPAYLVFEWRLQQLHDVTDPVIQRLNSLRNLRIVQGQERLAQCDGPV